MIKFENKVNDRYYYLDISKDLFNSFILNIYRGGSNKSVIKRHSYESRDAIDKAIQVLSRRRIQRGYTLIA